MQTGDGSAFLLSRTETKRPPGKAAANSCASSWVHCSTATCLQPGRDEILVVRPGGRSLDVAVGVAAGADVALGVLHVARGQVGQRTIDRELLERRARCGDVFFQRRKLDVRKRAVDVELLERLADFEGGGREGYGTDA